MLPRNNVLMALRTAKSVRFMTRNISVTQSPPSNTTSLSQTATTPDNIDSEVLSSEIAGSLEQAKFAALGSPPSVVSIESPASVPVYIRHGSLVSIYGSSVENVQVTTSFLEPIKRTIYGVLSLRYQKLLSTSVFSILVGSGGKSLATVVVDGTTDWALLTRGALLAYTGNSLHVSTTRVPRYSSRKLVKSLGLKGLPHTGLFSWTKAGYTLVSGRGQIAVSGYGSIYNVNVPKGEELIIRRENLVGLTVNDDLGGCVVAHTFGPKPSEKAIIKETLPAKVSAKFSDITTLKISPPQKALEYVKLAFYKSQAFFSKFSFNLNLSQGNFVKVIGPRNLLVQSSVKGRKFLRSSSNSGIATSSSSPVTPTSADYLSYVTIQPGKPPIIESTPDFKETVEKIGSRVKKE